METRADVNPIELPPLFGYALGTMHFDYIHALLALGWFFSAIILQVTHQRRGKEIKALKERLTFYRSQAVDGEDSKLLKLQKELEFQYTLKDKVYEQQLQAEARAHASEMNSHRVQEICMREIARLQRLASKNGEKVELSPHIAAALTEFQAEEGADRSLGPWAAPA